MVDNFWILVTQVGSILVYVGVAFVLYRLLAAQKDATIQAKDATIENLQKRLDESESKVPDVLVEQLERRLEVAKKEIARLKRDTKRPLSEIEALRKKQEVTSEIVVNLLDTIKVFKLLSNPTNALYKDFVVHVCGSIDEAVKTILSAYTVADLVAKHGKALKEIRGDMNVLKANEGRSVRRVSWSSGESPEGAYKIFEEGRIEINSAAINEFTTKHKGIRKQLD